MKKRIYAENSVFKPDLEAPHLNACVGSNGNLGTFKNYAHAYLAAALALIDSCEREYGVIDLMIYPIAYNFRHGIELYLKRFFNELIPQNQGKKLHELRLYWDPIKQHIDKDSRFALGIDAVNEMEKIISDVIEIDNSAQTFRFPVSKQDARHLESRSLINIGVLKEVILQVEDIFSRWDSMLEEQAHQQHNASRAAI